MDFARSLWLRIETLHAVTYFGEETQRAGSDLGLSGFWMGYFGFRGAPLGPVEPGVVDAAFANFAPTFVRRWVPAVWESTDPAVLIERRSRAAAETLRRVAPGIEAAARAAAPFLDAAIASGVAVGRPLFAANRDVAMPSDEVEALWQRCTTLREHRGDGH
ncbi:MAG: SCO6745 family protein, partial [Aquihabitans sp.]